MKKALVIFGKTPVPGKVKTRLAVDIGEKEACDIYRKLLFHTFDIADACTVFVVASFPEKSDFILDAIPYSHFHKQVAGDLGEKMKEATYSVFGRGFEKVLCIGSDCADITPEIINEAYKQLDSNDVVIGPAKDGGYYLIGTNKPSKYLFQGINWSTSEVLDQTLSSIKNNNETYFLLEELSDIDTLEDLNNSNFL